MTPGKEGPRAMSAPMLDGESTSPWGILATPRPPIRHPPNIADQYSDLLQALPPSRRAGLIIELAVGYYENWRPTRMEVADMIAVELGELALHRFIERKASGNYFLPIKDSTRHLGATHRANPSTRNTDLPRTAAISHPRETTPGNRCGSEGTTIMSTITIGYKA